MRRKSRIRMGSQGPDQNPHAVIDLPEELLRDFRGGLNTQDLPMEDVAGGSGAPDPNSLGGMSMYLPSFPECKNLFVSHRGRLEIRPGQHALTPNIGAAGQGVMRFSSPTLTRLIVAAGGSVYAGDETTLPATMTTISTGFNAAGRVYFQAAFGVLYFCDGTHAPRKWTGTGSSQLMGIVAPTTAITIADGGAGLLDSSQEEGLNPYTYWTTFYNSTQGIESSPGPQSATLDVTLKRINLSAIPVSSDPQVNARRIYRMGGTLTTIRLVATIADNTTTTYTDNIADLSMGDILMPETNDPPAATLRNFLFHKNRMFAHDGTDIWFSNFGQPEYWAAFVSDLDTDGGHAAVDPDNHDKIVALATLGSVLLIFRSRTTYAMLGDTWNDFVVRPLTKPGCAATGSVVETPDNVVFLGSDGQIYAIEGATGKPTWLSQRIADRLYVIPAADRANAQAAYVDQRYIISIPLTAGGCAAFAYDFRDGGSWSELSAPYFSAGAMWAEGDADGGDELLLATAPGYTDTAGAAFNGVVSALGFSDLHETPMDVAFRTPSYEFDRPTWIKRAKKLRIEGICQPASGSVLAYVTAYTPGKGSVSHTYELQTSGSESTLIDRKLHPDLTGRQISIRIIGNVSNFEIHTISLHYQYVRAIK